DERREAFNLKLARELRVLLFHCVALLLVAREIELYQNQIFGRISLELRLGKDFRAQALAPATPIRAGEIQEDELVVALGFRLGRIVVGEPIEVGPRATDPGENGKE